MHMWSQKHLHIYIYLIPGLSRHVFLCSNPWGMHVRGRPCSQMVFLTCNTGYKLCNQDSIRPIGLPPVTTSEPNGSSTSDTVWHALTRPRGVPCFVWHGLTRFDTQRSNCVKTCKNVLKCVTACQTVSNRVRMPQEQVPGFYTGTG